MATFGNSLSLSLSLFLPFFSLFSGLVYFVFCSWPTRSQDYTQLLTLLRHYVMALFSGLSNDLTFACCRPLLAPYRAILRYHRCDYCPISRDTFSGRLTLPQNGAMPPPPPPLGLSVTQAHLCDTPCCNISHGNCAISHTNNQETRRGPEIHG